MIVSTDAIVLKGMLYRETSRILTLYTRNFGKLSVLAKGARGRGGRFGSSLQPMNCVHAVLYKKETSEMGLLSQCDTLQPLNRLTDDVERMAPAMAMVEIVDAACHSEEENQPLFELLLDGLRTVNGATKSPVIALYAFEVHLLDLLGFRPEFRTCSRCGGPVEGASESAPETRFRIVSGGILCGKCSVQGKEPESVSGGAVKALQFLQNAPGVGASTRLALSPQILNEVGRALRWLMRGHIEGLRALKSEQVFSALL